MRTHLSRRSFIQKSACGIGCYSLAGRTLLGKSPWIQGFVEPCGLPQRSAVPEPYKGLSGGSFCGRPIAESPDPLIRYRWVYPRPADALQSYVLHPVADFSETPENLRVTGTDGPTALTINGVGSIRFDFGVESPAWLEFDSADRTGSVEMSISEYTEPAVVNTGPAHPIKTAVPRRYGNTYRLELNAELYEGVRFGWIHVRTFEQPWHISAVRVVCQVKPTNYEGSFSCSDPMLTHIWYTGAYSVKANLGKDSFGAILMDRGDRISWTGDAYPAQAAALVAFGNWDFIRENLERTAGTSNGIESYSLCWVLSLLDYYRHTGDTQVLNRYIDHTLDLLKHAESIFANPSISFYGWDERLGAGFENPEIPETKHAFQMLFVRACNEFAEAMNFSGRAELAETYRRTALEKMQYTRLDQTWVQSCGLHALADAVNTGLLTEDEQLAIFQKEFSDRLNRLSYSPFNQYFVMQAMARMNSRHEALVSTHDMWGGQIEYGGTLFFETYTPSWNQCIAKHGAPPNCQAGYTSLGHAWGAGITAWLSHEVLGITPLSPGFDRVQIAPHLGDTVTWVAGTLPTPHGLVSVFYDISSGRGKVEVPSGCMARIGVPKAGRTIASIAVNGKPVWKRHLLTTTGISRATQAKDAVFLEDLQPGTYTLAVSYKGRQQEHRAESLLYPMSLAKEDATTSGDWGSVYGRDGYILFNYDGVKKDRASLPTYVKAVTPSTSKLGICLHKQLASATQEKRAPAPDRANNRSRSVGQLYTAAPSACQQTMTVDVEFTQAGTHQITLYFLDWERLDRRQAIEVFDLKTLRRMTPVQQLQSFAEGKYLAYRSDRSLKFRINQIRGENAVLNGIFFDPVT